MPSRAGYVAIIGRPNVGKSTFLNTVLGEKIAIVSPKPQTTRNRIAGIWTDDARATQVVLLDTPGIHAPFAGKLLNEAMVKAATSTLEDVDLVLWIVDGAESAAHLRRDAPPVDPMDVHIADLVARAGLPVLLLLNKFDVVDPHQRDGVVIAWKAIEARFPEGTCQILPVAALTGDGIPLVLDEIAARIPEGEYFFPEDQLMDGTERFVVSELIREKIVHLTRQEIPYATAVEIERFDESQREGQDPFVRICARILVERDSQKGIVIGKGGAMLREIGTLARQDIETLLGARVFLDLHVVVERDWTRNKRILKDLGIE